MTPRGSIRGTARFGTGPGAGGFGITIDAQPGDLGNHGRSPQGDIVRGPNSENMPVAPAKYWIQITGGGTDGKYDWQRVFPGAGSDAVTSANNGSGTHGGYYAYEVSGDESVPTDGSVLVEATESDLGPWINFSAPGGGGAGMSLVNVTSATADSDGAWPATLYINNGDGTWGTGPVIRMQVTPMAGTTFAVGDYWAEKNGTTIGDGTTRTVTDGVLNSTTTITSASAAFVAGDVGAKVTGTGIPVNTVIASRTNSTTVVLSHAATATATGVHITIVTQVTYDLYFDVGAIQYEKVGCSGGVPGTYLITTAWPWTIGSFVPD